MQSHHALCTRACRFSSAVRFGRAKIPENARWASIVASVTEIPEHLLKRSAAARARSSGADASADSATPSATAASTPSATPATVSTAAPAVAPAPPAPVSPAPVPDIPVVAAAKARNRVPSWAMFGLAILPIWAFMYVRSLTPSVVEATGPVGDGEQVWAKCSSCHGGAGQGGSGRPVNDGEVYLTFPYIEDQLNLVYTGSEAYSLAGVGPYGDASRGHLNYQGAWMPAKGGAALTDAEVLAVVCYTRYGLNDGDEASPEYGLWCSEDSEIFAALESGSATFDTLAEQFGEQGVIPVGTEPRRGTSGPRS
jgi:mono/diheme cytochrome c family protein